MITIDKKTFLEFLESIKANDHFKETVIMVGTKKITCGMRSAGANIFDEWIILEHENDMGTEDGVPLGIDADNLIQRIKKAVRDDIININFDDQFITIKSDMARIRTNRLDEQMLFDKFSIIKRFPNLSFDDKGIMTSLPKTFIIETVFTILANELTSFFKTVKDIGSDVYQLKIDTQKSEMYLKIGDEETKDTDIVDLTRPIQVISSNVDVPITKTILDTDKIFSEIAGLLSDTVTIVVAKDNDPSHKVKTDRILMYTNKSPITKVYSLPVNLG